MGDERPWFRPKHVIVLNNNSKLVLAVQSYLDTVYTDKLLHGLGRAGIVYKVQAYEHWSYHHK